MKACRRSRSIPPLILDLRTDWQRLVGTRCEEKTLLPLPAIEPRPWSPQPSHFQSEQFRVLLKMTCNYLRAQSTVVYAVCYHNESQFKSRWQRWEEHVARMGREMVRTGFWWWNLREDSHLEDSGGRIILKSIFQKWDGWAWTGWAPVNAVMYFRVP